MKRAQPSIDDALSLASRALASGQPFPVLKLLALRDDAFALALRGLALAQLGDLDRARQVLERAARKLKSREPLAHARCIVALAEIALANRDFGALAGMRAALSTLEEHGDRANALHARLLELRRHVLLGQMHAAEGALETLDLRGAPALHLAVAAALEAEVALRTLQAKRAAKAVARARDHARRANIPALIAEIDTLAELLSQPAARAIEGGAGRSVTVAEVERRLARKQLVVDACRRSVQGAGRSQSLRQRPVLFALVRTLAEAWPESVPRDQLLEAAFGVTRVNDSQRLRLRVEIARLRKVLTGLADIEADPRGFRLITRDSRPVLVLAPPIEGEDAEVLALLADGVAWSSAALATALGTSQRSVQRALAELEAQGRVRGYGKARARRWTSPPLSGIATTLLLPMPRTAR